MWGVIITVVLQIIGWILGKVQANEETKEKFFEFVKLAANDVKSAKLKKWGEQQLDYFKNNPWKPPTMEKKLE